jgi:hypothetical protein
LQAVISQVVGVRQPVRVAPILVHITRNGDQNKQMTRQKVPVPESSFNVIIVKLTHAPLRLINVGNESGSQVAIHPILI